MIEPMWLQAARRDVGLRELPGAPTAPKIARWLAELGAWWRDDATPWCGVAVAAWLRAAGEPVPRHWYRAQAWLDWGRSINGPCLGCVVVFGRAGGGHVGLVVGRDQRGRLLVLGGNQGDAVSVAPFDMARVLGYRWPPHEAFVAIPLPTLASVAVSSSNEA